MANGSEGSQPWWRHKLICLVPLLIAVVLCVLRISYRKRALGAWKTDLGLPRFTDLENYVQTPPYDVEFPRVMLFGTALVLNLILLSAAIVVLAIILCKLYARLKETRTRYILLVAPLPAIVAALHSILGWWPTLRWDTLVYEALLDMLASCLEISPLECRFVTCRNFVRWLEGFGFACDWLSIFSIFGLLLQLPFAKKADAATELRDRLDDLNKLLFVASGLLLAHNLRVGTVIEWCSAFFSAACTSVFGETARQLVDRLAVASVVSDSLFYSLAIFLVYCPAALILTHEVARERAKGEKDPLLYEQKWLRDCGFPIALGDWVSKIALILSPALGGFFLDKL